MSPMQGTDAPTFKPLDPQLVADIEARARRVPIFNTLGFQVVEMGEGACSVRVPHRSEFDGIYESFHGGLLMTVADTVACFALMTLVGTEEVLTTTDMNIRFLAPCLTDVIARARVIKKGRSLCPMEVNLYDTAERHVAVAQVTYMRLPQMPSR